MLREMGVTCPHATWLADYDPDLCGGVVFEDFRDLESEIGIHTGRELCHYS